MKIDTLILSVTDDCNLACRYCFVQHQPNYMTWEVAKRSVDFLVENNIDNNDVLTITFFGGEPMLTWDKIIVPLVDYCKTLDRKFSFSITTNGTLLTYDRLIFMKKNNFNLLLSIDGNKKTQNFNRPYKDGSGSFDQLMANLPDILSFYPKVLARGTLYPDTVEYFIQNIMFFHSLGFKSCFFIPDTFSQWSEEETDILLKGLREYSLYFIDAYRTNKNIISFIPITKQFNNAPWGSETQCGLGVGTVAINYKGEILACQELTSYNKENNPYLLGSIFSDMNQLQIDVLKKEISTKSIVCEEPALCKTCSFQSYCEETFCHVNSFLQYGQFLNTRKKIECIWLNGVIENANIIEKILISNNNKIFIKDYYQKGG